MGRAAVYVDRDGVINDVRIESDGTVSGPLAPEDLQILPGVPHALERLHDGGFVLVVVSNQPDVARGRLAADCLATMDRLLLERLPIDEVRSCPHDVADSCSCRKPRPGLLTAAAADLDIDLTRSWLVGDRWVDIAAARAAGVKSVLVERPWSWLPTSSGSPADDLAPDDHVDDLATAAERILAARSDNG